jgi:hypothetical protein
MIDLNLAKANGNYANVKISGSIILIISNELVKKNIFLFIAVSFS